MICWFHVNGNRRQSNEKFCHLVFNYEGGGFIIQRENFRRFTALFIARNREIVGRHDWIQDSDPYLKPICSTSF